MDIEINTRNTEKFIPHPILDDTDKMMRIIANPVYDQLTIARAANFRKLPLVRKSVRIAEVKEQTTISSIKSLNHDEPSLTSNKDQSESKNYSKRPSLPPISLITRSSTHRTSPRISRPSAISRTSSLHSSTIENDKRPITDGTIRFVTSRHGFEMQRYSSPNWLSVDLLAKEACDPREKTFRDMLNQKERNDLSTRSVYTSEYYRKRFDDLLQSYKDGHLTHDQWARQNYQLNCLQRFYAQTFEREQQELDLQEQNQRQRRAQCIFNEWKEAKGEGGYNEHRRSRISTGNSHRTSEMTSVLSNPSSSFANHMSIASIMADQMEELPLVRPIKQSQHSTKPSDMFNEQRWSLNAMLKRVVGLAEPLPPPSIIKYYQHSSITNVSSDSSIESTH